jgi:hypothetical protein
VSASRRRLIFLLALAGLLAPEAGAQDRRLASRALFAALDSAAVEDSSRMRPMNQHERLDSIMVEMAGFLDRHIGPAYGLAATRVRHWDGYGTQAHPTLGILVDSGEIAGLLQRVSSHKGAAGVPAEEITRRLEYVVRFLVAHEYGHLMQYRSFGRDSVASLNATRVIECGADLLGGVGFSDYLASRYGSALPEGATQTAIDFGYVVGGSDWLDGTTHPLPEDRRRCIERGVEVAAELHGARAVRAGAADSATLTLARRLNETEPELYRGKVSLMSWSQTRSREFVSARTIVDSSAVLAVVRDSSVERLVRRLAAATAKGRAELRKLRGARAPSGKPPYLLREALPAPWECVIGEVDGAETARCDRTIRGGFSYLEQTDLEQAVKAALRETRWRQIAPERGQGTYKIVFAETGSDPANPRSARIEIFIDQDSASGTVQMLPEERMSLYFRTKR